MSLTPAPAPHAPTAEQETVVLLSSTPSPVWPRRPLKWGQFWLLMDPETVPLIVTCTFSPASTFHAEVAPTRNVWGPFGSCRILMLDPLTPSASQMLVGALVQL